LVISESQVTASQPSILPSVARARERAIGRVVKDFMSFLQESITSVLDDGCAFSEFQPVLLMYLSNLTTMTNADFVEPYHSQLRQVERDLRECERLRNLNLDEVASAQVETVLEERAKFVAQAEEESEALLGKVVFLQACQGLAEEEYEVARCTARAQIESIATANRVIAEAKVFLDQARHDYEIVAKRLEELEVEEQKRTASIQAHEDELEKVNVRVSGFMSVPEGELHQIALDNAWNESVEKLQRVEERLRSIGEAARPPLGLS
jgi:chromosome segregation ATPase